MSRERLFRSPNGQRVLTGLIVLALLLSAGAPAVQAAPPAQGPVTDQIARVKTVLKNLGYVECPEFWLTSECPNTPELRFRVMTSTPFFDLKPGGEYVEVAVYVFPPESANLVPDLFDREYAAMSARMGKSYTPQRFTIGNTDAAVIGYGVQIQNIPVNTGPEYYSGENKGILTCGTVFLDMLLLQLGGLESEDQHGEGNRLMEQMIPRSKARMEKIASALQAAGACSATPPATKTPTTKPTAKATATATGVPSLKVWINAAYDEDKDQIDVFAGVEKRPEGSVGGSDDFEWSLDSAVVKQGRELGTIQLSTAGLAAGGHVVGVKITDSGTQASGSAAYPFTKKTAGGSSLKVWINAAYDEAKDQVDVFAGVEKRPEGSVGGSDDFEWSLDGAVVKQGRELGTIQLSTASLVVGEHTILVKITDSGTQASGTATYQITKKTAAAAAAGSGAVDVTTPAGATTVQPGGKTTITLSANNKAEIRARCEKLQATIASIQLASDYSWYDVISLPYTSRRRQADEGGGLETHWDIEVQAE